MVLQIAYAALSSVLPPKYYPHAVVALVVLLVVHAFARGRTTNRDRDLHARVILVTGAFNPLGLALVTALATRGAHIIALSPHALSHPAPAVLVPLLRVSTRNEHIYAEHADLADPVSVRAFCTRFLTTPGADTRIDALVLAHEYTSLGTLLRSRNPAQREKEREAASLATFLLITLLLPALLVAPPDRDIRIVSVVNPFYAAAGPSFATSLADSSTSAPPLFLAEGRRALRTVVLTRHLQRILDSLPNRAHAASDATSPSGSNEASASGPDSARRLSQHPSNIVAVSACPGLSRKDTVEPLLGASRGVPDSSPLGAVLYALLFPLLYLLAKPPGAALQSVLHVLFLPTPFKRAQAHLAASLGADAAAAPTPSSDKSPREEKEREAPEEVLKPGALYRECAVVRLEPPVPPKEQEGEDEGKGGLPDDGELGGEALGRAVWEWYEARLKVWEKGAKTQGEAEKGREREADQQKERGEGEKQTEDKQDGGS
ncbi:hypothetical protein SCP_0701860 [Sparassis crispa]|uniref:Ketoreductase (KR) domain-containing protein n=1 Tax=Sparassis crispa TaxID=139825 RepID=A0A401GRX9_9APHY|nr:hypothetical protein SCP_0701860 [Sparassis crispa]GBE85001.1 hypothetical protein SCP_0701860 [Sparassis crispa]